MRRNISVVACNAPGRESGRWQGATEAELRQLERNWIEYKV